MYTIAFDETQNFEVLVNQREDRRKPTMLCGVIYNDCSEEACYKDGKSVEPERERIKAYYQMLCSNVHTSYPQDLHYNRTRPNKAEERVTKAEFTRTIAEFLKYGTYRGEELLFCDAGRNLVQTSDVAVKRKGHYQLVTILYDHESSIEVIGNELQRDDVASNLYLNMISEFIKKGIFYNPLITEDIPDITFNLPTRSLQRNLVPDAEQYTQYGYFSGNQFSINIADTSYYHALVTQCSDKRNINVKGLYTIKVEYPEKDTAPMQEFLYLADSICAALSYRISLPQDKSIRERMGQYNNPTRNLFFYYEGTDDYYDQAANALLRKDVFSALGAIYDGEHNFTVQARTYYKKKWFPIIEKKLLESCTSGMLNKDVDDLAQYRYADNLNQRKLLYLLRKTEELAKNIKLDKQHQFILNDIGITAYTHVGDAKKANDYYQKCMALSDSVGTDDVQRAKVRYITTLNGMLMYPKAKEQALDIFGITLENAPKVEETRQNLVQKVIAKLFPGKNKKGIVEPEPKNDQIIHQLPESVSRPNLFRALSSLGQTYAFMNDSMAEYCFQKALNDIDDQANYLITESYLLHYYIETGDEANYKKYAKEYFNGVTHPLEQLAYLIKEGSKARAASPRFTLGYAMFVFIKGFYVFDKEKEEYAEVTRKLVNLKDTVCSLVPNGDQLMVNHPWELIYKYSAMLANYVNLENRSSIRSENKRLAKEAAGPHPEYLLAKILEYGDIELLLQGIDGSWESRMQSKVNKLWNDLVSNGKIQCHEDEIISVEEKLAEFKGLFSYMYH